MKNDEKYLRISELEDYIKNYLSENGHENFCRFCIIGLIRNGLHKHKLQSRNKRDNLHKDRVV